MKRRSCTLCIAPALEWHCPRRVREGLAVVQEEAWQQVEADRRHHRHRHALELLRLAGPAPVPPPDGDMVVQLLGGGEKSRGGTV